MNHRFDNGFSIRRITRLLAAMLIVFMVIPATEAQTIKLATLAPEGSSWMDDMRAGAKEIGERTDGRVTFKFYGGGVMGNDRTVMKKMRIGQLHGGAFTANTLAKLEKNTQLFGMPMLFESLEEVKFARDRMEKRIGALLEQAGYVSFGFASGGFAHIMSNRPIANLEDMQGLKVWVPDGDEISYGAIRALGVSPVTMPLTDVLTGLQTELIDTIIGPPAGTIILQWNTGVSYITELPLAYSYASLVISKKYFDGIQPADQAVVREVMERVYQGFEQRGNDDNAKAYQALLGDGMKSVTPNQDQVYKWQQTVRESNHRLAADGALDIGLLNEIECLVSAYRTNDLEKDCTQ